MVPNNLEFKLKLKMNGFTKTNITSNVYWIKEPLEDLLLRIRIRPKENLVLLPKLEENSLVPNTQNILDDYTQEFEFKWQAKVFSQYEIKTYSDIHNCSSEWQMNLHNKIKENGVFQKVFTYLNEDCFMPMPFACKKSYDAGLLELTNCLAKMNINDITKDILISNESVVSNVWTAMHIMYDNSKYDEECNLIYRDECLLLSVYHNAEYNYLMIVPDINDISNPYVIESASGELNLEYFVDINFGSNGCSEELLDLLNKLHRKWQKKQKYILPFDLPPPGHRKLQISIEIASATDFETDNLYIEYYIKIPDRSQCKSDLTGRTHVTESLATDDGQMWMFGHTIELELDVAESDLESPIKLFFEVISLDWWGRHRTEGYAHLALSCCPGFYKERLSCSRPDEMSQVEADSRRFFVGGCHLIEDLEVVEKPQLFTTNFKTISTGFVLVNWSIISQCHTPTLCMAAPSGSNVLEGAEAVLKQYKRAKATLAAATKSFRDVGYE